MFFIGQTFLTMSVFLWPIKLFHIWLIWKKPPHQFNLDIESKFNVETSITIRMRISCSTTWQKQRRDNEKKYDDGHTSVHVILWSEKTAIANSESRVLALSSQCLYVSLSALVTFSFSERISSFSSSIFLSFADQILSPLSFSALLHLRGLNIFLLQIFSSFSFSFFLLLCRPNIFFLQMFSSHNWKNFPHQI